MVLLLTVVIASLLEPEAYVIAGEMSSAAAIADEKMSWQLVYPVTITHLELSLQCPRHLFRSFLE